jgi:hypothetical protein
MSDAVLVSHHCLAARASEAIVQLFTRYQQQQEQQDFPHVTDLAPMKSSRKLVMIFCAEWPFGVFKGSRYVFGLLHSSSQQNIIDPYIITYC